MTGNNLPYSQVHCKSPASKQPKLRKEDIIEKVENGKRKNP